MKSTWPNQMIGKEEEAYNTCYEAEEQIADGCENWVFGVHAVKYAADHANEQREESFAKKFDYDFGE